VKSPTPADPVSARDSSTHSPDGVDLTLIRWMLSLSYEQRLRVLQTNLRSLQRLRRAAGGE